MKKYAMFTLILIVAMLGIPVSHSARAQADSNWRTFRGAWFEIQYPANFRARRSLPSSSSTQGYDSAFFYAPDGSVEFYVFSPQWNGTPSDIEINLQFEVMISQEVTHRSGKSIHRATVKARDGSYMRSFEDTQDLTTNTRRVFGFKYVNTASYNQYRATYLTFKASLKQFAD